MRRIVLLIAILCSPAALLFAEVPSPPQSIFVIHNVTVINPGTNEVLPGRDVEVSSGKIVRVEKSPTSRPPAGMKAIDGSGKFLIPGLWDMHVHSAFGDWLPGGRQVILPLFVANGVTGIRDMGSDLPIVLGWKHAIDKGELLGPRMIVSGPMLDGPVPRFPSSVPIRNSADARAAVDTLKAQGADFIKVQSLIPREAFFAAADEARKQGSVLVGHVPDAVRASEAADAGEKSIEHFTGVFEGCSTAEDEFLKGPKRTQKMVETFNQQRASALIARFAKDKTWQVPTLVWDVGGSLIDESDFSHSPLLPYVPPYWRTQTWRQFKVDMLKDMEADPVSYRRRFIEMTMQMTLAMHQAGVPFMAGTDTAAGVFILPGFSLHDELALFVKAGFTPMEALQTATSNPARFLGLERSMGSIEAGKLADMVLLDADPLNDIHATTKIDAVILAGRYLPRATLDQVLSDVAKASQSIR